MKDTATFRRTAAAVGLAGAVLTSADLVHVLEPPFRRRTTPNAWPAIDEGGAARTGPRAVLFAALAAVHAGRRASASPT